MSIRTLARRPYCSPKIHHDFKTIPRRFTSSVTSTPERLKIAFFGSDNFSVRSLHKLLKYKSANPEKIESIHVITRTAKFRGRKAKVSPDLAIASYCKHTELNDLVFRADSASEILSLMNANQYNMSIAVAYGVLIPSEFIAGCKFGGLNVHPSLLPKYSGSSPIQYALMNGDTYTGCTIQTLHPTKFDGGDILLQSEDVAIVENDNYYSLERKLGTIGANLLTEVIDKEIYKGTNHTPLAKSRHKFSLASKIPSSKSEIIWSKYDSHSIRRLESALGSLYSYKEVDITRKKKEIKGLQKVDFEDIRVESSESLNFSEAESLKEHGQFQLQKNAQNPRLLIKTIDGIISVGKLKFECYNLEDPSVFMRALQKRAGSTPHKFVYKK